MARYGKKAGKKVERAMHEMKEGTLKSGRSGKKVTSKKQAIAIGLSEARKEGAKVPKKSSKKGGKKSGKKRSSKKRTSKKKEFDQRHGDWLAYCAGTANLITWSRAMTKSSFLSLKAIPNAMPFELMSAR